MSQNVPDLKLYNVTSTEVRAFYAPVTLNKGQIHIN